MAKSTSAPSTRANPISEYTRKRNFDVTSEPPEEVSPRTKNRTQALRFVIQKHDARALHYDFRLEMEGTLKSWAIPKGPSLDPANKRMAILTEDHPLSYAKFEGHIPHGQYGGGDVIVWDQGIWQPDGNATAGYQSGKLKFTLIGEKLKGSWTLVRMNGTKNKSKEAWLLIKEHDEVARPSAEYEIVTERPESVITGRLLPRDETEKKSTAIPETLSPQLATLVSEPPPGNWLYEIKFDGYRMLARILKGKVTFYTREGHDWTSRLPLQVKAIEALKIKDTWLDGEVVVLNENGLPDFQALQNAFDVGSSHDIIFYLFDAPFLNGMDLRKTALEERRRQLQKILSTQTDGPLRYSAVFDADHESIVASACALSLEGVIGKRAGSHYVSRRSNDWIKLKCRMRQEFVIVGYTEPKGSRHGFGAILLAVHSDIGSKELLYAGRVGTGFNETRLQDIYKKMRLLERSTPPVSTKLTSAQKRDVHWIEPRLICEVEFAEWTGEGVLRQAAFISLRTDKPAKDIIREKSQPLNAPAATKKTMKNKTTKEIKVNNGKINILDVSISHPQRILDSESGKTKLELAQFYEDISDFILPHLSHRPVSLLRAPDGIEGEQFFQKHADNKVIPHIKQLDPSLDPGHGPLLEIDNANALIGCVQMNTIEFHTWGATTSSIATPDRLIFDLDPDPALPWRSVVEATRLTLSLLDELALNAFIKTTGGKGMHILVPLTPGAGWDYVKTFSKTIAEFMAKQIPERFVAKMGPKNRIGRIFIDYLRNTRGASTVCAYSVRARSGLPVSVPISRDELDNISHSNQWNIENLQERMDNLKSDPWKGYTGLKYKKNQKITKAMWERLGVEEPESPDSIL